MSKLGASTSTRGDKCAYADGGAYDDDIRLRFLRGEGEPLASSSSLEVLCEDGERMARRTWDFRFGALLGAGDAPSEVVPDFGAGVGEPDDDAALDDCDNSSRGLRRVPGGE